MGQQQQQQQQQQRRHLRGSSRGRAEALPAAATLQKFQIKNEGTGSGEVGQLQQQQHCGMTGRVEGWGWGSSSGSSGSSSGGTFVTEVGK